jgi:hypothetical protein
MASSGSWRGARNDGSHAGEQRARRPSSHVTAESLALAPVAAVDDLAGVHVDAAHFGDGVGGIIGGGLRLDRDDQAKRRLPRAVAGDANALRGSGVAGREARLLVAKLGWLQTCFADLNGAGQTAFRAFYWCSILGLVQSELWRYAGRRPMMSGPRDTRDEFPLPRLCFGLRARV